MCAVNDTLAKFCGYDSIDKEGGKYLERRLCNSCSDTHLVSKDYVKRMGLTDKVNRNDASGWVPLADRAS